MFAGTKSFVIALKLCCIYEIGLILVGAILAIAVRSLGRPFVPVRAGVVPRYLRPGFFLPPL